MTALVGLVGRNKRRYGGYIVHVGVVLILLGFAGEGFKLEQQMLLRPGQETTLGDYTLRYDRLRVTEDEQKQAVTAYIAVLKDGRQIDTLHPAKWFFFKRAQEPPTTEVAIRRTVAEDLYITLAAHESATQAASFQVTVNPLVNWVWFGFGVLALRTGIALLPERALGFAVSKATAREAAVTTVTLLVVLLLLGQVVVAQAPVGAQHSQVSGIDPHPPRNAAERSVGEKLVCMCGGCLRELVATCTCGTAAQTRGEIATLLDQGKSEDEILRALRREARQFSAAGHASR